MLLAPRVVSHSSNPNVHEENRLNDEAGPTWNPPSSTQSVQPKPIKYNFTITAVTDLSFQLFSGGLAWHLFSKSTEISLKFLNSIFQIFQVDVLMTVQTIIDDRLFLINETNKIILNERFLRVRTHCA